MGMYCCETNVRIDCPNAIAIYRLGDNNDSLRIPNQDADIVPPNGYVHREAFMIPIVQLKESPEEIDGIVYGAAFEQMLPEVVIGGLKVQPVKMIGNGVDVYLSEDVVKEYQPKTFGVIQSMHLRGLESLADSSS